MATVTAETTRAPRLTSLSPGAGCACKLPLAKLEQLFAGLQGAPAMGPAAGDLLVGAAEGDDAAAGGYRPVELFVQCRQLAVAAHEACGIALRNHAPSWHL